MVRELEIILWKTYLGSKTGHDEWKQNNKQQHGLLKLSFAKHKFLQNWTERVVHGCLMLIFIFYSSSGSIWILPRDLKSPCAGHLYQVSCLHPNASRRKANNCLNIRDLFLGRRGWAQQGICKPMKTLLLLKALDSGLSQVLWWNNLFLTRNWWILLNRVEGRWALLRFDQPE